MADSHQDIWSFDSPQSVQLAAAQALQANGVVVPRAGSSDFSSTKTGSFGVPMISTIQRTLPISFRGYSFQLPRVFVECVQFLEEHTECEGLFRKAGSVNRQKAIRTSLENGSCLSGNTNVHDVASLLKQYLRLLPDLLFTRHLSPVFEACVSQTAKEKQIHCLLLACLLLPPPHLQCLGVLMALLSRVCEKKDGSRMTASNLAIVMAPNLLTTKSSVSDFVASGNPLFAQTTVIEYLIENCNLIGQVPPEVGVALESCKSTIHAANSFEDMIEETTDLPERYTKRKKLRTSSLSGLVLGLGSRFKLKSTAIFSGDTTASSSADNKKRMLAKRRRGSDDDLLGERSKIVNSNHMLALRDISLRHSTQNKALGNGSKSKLRPLSGRQCPSHMLSKSKLDHGAKSGPILFQKGVSSQVKFYPLIPSLSSPPPKPASPPVTNPESKAQTSCTEVPTAAGDEVCHLSGFSSKINLKHSTSEPDILSSWVTPPDLPSPTVSKRVCLEANVCLQPKPVKSITNSQSVSTLSSGQLLSPLKFSAPLPVPFPLSQEDEVCKLSDPESELLVSSQTSSDEHAITESRSQNPPFLFSMPTPIHPTRQPLTHPHFDTSPCVSANSEDDNMPHPSCQPPFSVSPGGSVSEFDRAFLQTPHMGTISPNLLEKINSEIVHRSHLVPVKETTPFSSHTPLNLHRDMLQHVNESYKKAVLSDNTFRKPFEQGVGESEFKAPRACHRDRKPAIVSGGSDKVSSDECFCVSCPPMTLAFDNSSLADENRTPSSVGSPWKQSPTTDASDSISKFSSSSGADHTPHLEGGDGVQESMQTDDKIKTAVFGGDAAQYKDDQKPAPTANAIVVGESTSKRHQQARKGSVLSPPRRSTTHSGKTRQRMKLKANSNSQMKQRYAYSATLGIGDSLVCVQSWREQRLNSPVKTSPKRHAPVPLSATLGITSLTLPPKRHNYSQSFERKSKGVCSTVDGSLPVNAPETYPLSTETDSWGVMSRDKSCDMIAKRLVPEECVSPAPTLLKIVEANVAQSHKKQAGGDHTPDHAFHSPSKSTTPLKSLSNSPLHSRASVESTVGTRQQPVVDGTLRVGGVPRAPDSLLSKPKVKQTSFRKGTGLASPWFSHGRQKSCSSVTLSRGTNKSRAQLYMVKSSPLKQSPISVPISNNQGLPSNDSNKENQCCYSNPKSSSCQQEGEVEVKEWVV